VIRCLVLALGLDAEESSRPPSLGISVDVAADPLSAPDGLVVASVRPGSNGQRMGLQPGDRIVAIDGEAVATADDFRLRFEAKRIGEAVALTVVRDEEPVELQGELRRQTGVRDLAARAEALQQDLERLRGGDPAERPRYSLQELLVILRQIERDLPAAAAEFKRVYPEGRFRIGIHIDIDSHAPDEAADDGPAPAEVAPEAEGEVEAP